MLYFENVHKEAQSIDTGKIAQNCGKVAEDTENYLKTDGKIEETLHIMNKTTNSLRLLSK